VPLIASPAPFAPRTATASLVSARTTNVPRPPALRLVRAMRRAERTATAPQTSARMTDTATSPPVSQPARQVPPAAKTVTARLVIASARSASEGDFRTWVRR
jgi:hypothetical protein